MIWRKKRFRSNRHQMAEDNQLVQRAVANGPAAFRQLVEKYQYFVFTITMRVLRSREEAEEAAQDTFIKVHRTLGAFEQKSKFSTWLYTIAYRTALDHARRKRLPVDSIEDEENYRQIEDEGTPTPVEHTQHLDLRDQLQLAIEQLPPQDGLIISLFYLHERSVREIAEITGLTVTNVKTKLHRLRERLRETLEKQLHTEIEDWL